MIRNETFRDGHLIEAEIIDLDAGTVTLERDGKVVETRPMTGEEAERYAPPPPTTEDRLAALETVLITKAVVTEAELEAERTKRADPPVKGDDARTP